MGRRVLRLALSGVVAVSAFSFKKPFGEHMMMAAQAQAQSLEEEGRKAGEELRRFIETGRGDRRSFIRLFTVDNLRDEKFRDGMKEALGPRLTTQFNAIFDDRLKARFDQRGAVAVWRELAKQRKTLTARLERLYVPGARMENPEQMAHLFFQGGPKPAEALITMGLVGPEGQRQDIGGEYTQQNARRKLEQGRVETVQRLYLKLLQGDEEFKQFVKTAGGGMGVRPNGRYDDSFNHMVTQLEVFLSYYAQKDSDKARAFLNALQETGMIRLEEGKPVMEEREGFRTVTGFTMDGVLDEKMATVLAIYNIIQRGSWENEKKAGFLRDLENAGKPAEAAAAGEAGEAELPRVELPPTVPGVETLGEFSRRRREGGEEKPAKRKKR